MKFKHLEEIFSYDGSQLRSLFAYLEHNLQGDSILSWIGPCEIPAEKIVDGEDLLAGEEIRGSMMVHFIVEKFHVSLFTGVTMQRLLSALAIDVLKSLKSPLSSQLQRKGDDIFLEDKKLSISIATQSPVSTLIHFAVNISTEGTPVPTLGLRDLEVEPKQFALQLSEAFCQEVESMEQATTKVKWVK